MINSRPRSSASAGRPGRAPTLLLCPLVASGCGDDADAPRGATVEVQDSSGVELVSGAQGERLLGLEEVLRIGVLEGDSALQFDRIRSVALDESEGVWVVDSHESVRHYSGSGGYLGSVGSEGSGPGEAQGYSDVWTGDNSVVVSGYPGVLQRFRSDGTRTESTTSSKIGEGDLEILRPIGAAGGGRWVLTVEALRFSGPESSRNRVAVVVGRSLTPPWDTVMYIDGELRRRYQAGQENMIGRGSYFEGNPSLSVDTMGRIHLSDTVSYRIESYGLDGTLERVLTRSVEPRPFDVAWVSEIEATMRDRFGPNEAAFEREMAGALPEILPEVLPFIEQILVSRDGALWIRRADRHPRPGRRAVAHSMGTPTYAWEPEWLAPVVLDVFTPQGEYRGSVEAPAQFEPMAVSEDRVYGRLYDTLGVEYIVAYRLVES